MLLPARARHDKLPRMTITLFDYYRSSASYRVRIALNLKNLAYGRVDISLLEGAQREPDNLERNPQGFVPSLEIDGHVITQSMAIIDYLDGKFPEPPLYPQNTEARAAAMARALVIACDIHPINNLRILNYLKNDLGQPQEARDNWYRHWVTEGFDALETMAGDGLYLGGDTPDVSDICLVPQVYNARRFELDMARWPKLEGIDAQLQKIEAFGRAHPDAVKPPE